MKRPSQIFVRICRYGVIGVLMLAAVSKAYDVLFAAAPAAGGFLANRYVMSGLILAEMIAGVLLITRVLDGIGVLFALGLASGGTALALSSYLTGAPATCGCLGSAVTTGRLAFLSEPTLGLVGHAAFLLMAAGCAWSWLASKPAAPGTGAAILKPL